MSKRNLRRAMLALAVLIPLAVVADELTYDPQPWLADYTRLKRDMAQGYANLDWVVEQRGIDLAALDARTSEALQNANSRIGAFWILRGFVRSFKDPHFRMAPGGRPAPAPVPVAATSSPLEEQTDVPAGADCARSGYKEGDHAFRFPFARMVDWTPLRNGDFPSGLLGDIGVLRIADFGEDQYLAACQAVFKPGIGDRALQLQVRARQQAFLLETLDELRAKGARRLLVDVSGNGGGSEWVGDVTVLMTDKTLHRREALMVDPGCDRSAIWRGAPAPCPVLAPGSGERATLQGIGPWTGPVFVLVDRGTGSAAEDFVVWLQQNQVATVIGERTAGAGCGYVNGGNPTRLTVVAVDVWMPNCSRFLDDGTNEIEGIAPDIQLAMRGADPAVQAKALTAALSGR